MKFKVGDRVEFIGFNDEDIETGDIVEGMKIGDIGTIEGFTTGNYHVNFGVVSDEFKERELELIEDNVNHPSHYKTGNIEVIDFIEDQKLGYHLGNAIKYIARAEHKEKYVEDLKKAIWYLRREVERSE